MSNTNGDYISREDAISEIRADAGCDACELKMAGCCLACHAGQKMRRLEALPPADVRPVVTCEECKFHVDVGYHYCNAWCAPCPNDCSFFCAYGERFSCGADMRPEGGADG